MKRNKRPATRVFAGSEKGGPIEEIVPEDKTLDEVAAEEREKLHAAEAVRQRAEGVTAQQHLSATLQTLRYRELQLREATKALDSCIEACRLLPNCSPDEAAVGMGASIMQAVLSVPDKVRLLPAAGVPHPFMRDAYERSAKRMDTPQRILEAIDDLAAYLPDEVGKFAGDVERAAMGRRDDEAEAEARATADAALVTPSQRAEAAQKGGPS